MSNTDLEDWLTQIFYDELRGKTVTPEQEYIIGWAEKRLKPAIVAKFEEQYRKGYNANSRDCYCDSLGATEGVLPHRHLMSDGKSYNIRPDLAKLSTNKETEAEA